MLDDTNAFAPSMGSIPFSNRIVVSHVAGPPSLVHFDWPNSFRTSARTMVLIGGNVLSLTTHSSRLANIRYSFAGDGSGDAELGGADVRSLWRGDARVCGSRGQEEWN